jgi:hypothetical protein
MAKKPSSGRLRAGTAISFAGSKSAPQPGKILAIDEDGEGPEDQRPPTEVQTLPVPEFYGEQIQAFVSSNDITLGFSRMVPVMLGAQVGGTKLPAVILHLSPATAKDLSLLVGDLVAKHEKEWGKIETAYTRRRTAKKNK